MVKVLYRDAKRGDIRSGSYSARRSFKFCKRQFKLTRIDGWSEKILRGSAQFGKCVEAAIEYHIKNGSRGGEEHFALLWEQSKKIKTFDQWEYSKTEVSFDSMTRAGREMLRLFAIKLPSLPILNGPHKPIFQKRLVKEIFPGTQLAGLENKAYIDILSFPRFDHPMLDPPKPEEIFTAGVRPLIIDVKTSGVPLDPQLVKLDPQLGEYVWQYGESSETYGDTGFLWFEKKAHGVKNGSRVTTLVETSNYPAGWEVLVLAPDKNEGVWVGDKVVYDRFQELTCGPDGKDLPDKAVKLAKARFFAGGAATLLYSGEWTKQRLTFAATRITMPDVTDIGQGVGLVTVEMIQAHETGFYPKEGGIRFPDQKCNNCSMRWICMDDPVGRDENLVKFGEEWLAGDDGDTGE